MLFLSEFLFALPEQVSAVLRLEMRSELPMRLNAQCALNSLGDMLVPILDFVN